MGKPLLLVFLGFAVMAGGDIARAAEKLVVGWVERVRIFPGDLEVYAKIDTGANTSSLNAPDLKIFTRDGTEWVSFTVTNRRGVTQHFEAKVVRTARIRRHGGVVQRRPVVMLGVCLGSAYQETQVNLIDRKNFNYQMLIGRRFMAGRLIVDPGRTFIAKPVCQKDSAK